MRSILLLAASAGLLFAQGDSGRFTGTVTDGTGAVVPGSTIKIVNEKTGATREVQTGEQGTFIVNNLVASIYTVSGTATGMAPSEYKNVPLTVGQERNLTIVLAPAQLSNVSSPDGQRFIFAVNVTPRKPVQ